MRIFVVYLNLLPLYVMNYEMNEWITNHMDRRMIKFVFNSLVFMTLLSYLKASFTLPREIPQLAPTESEQ